MNASGAKVCVIPSYKNASVCEVYYEDYEAYYWKTYGLRAQEIIYILFYAIVFFCGITGNALVCFVLVRMPQMRTVTNLFIFNLAVTDLIVLVIVLIPTMLLDMIYTWPFGDIACPVVFYLQRASIIVSILTLTAISVERYFAISNPMKFKLDPTRVRLWIVIIWVIALVSSVPDLVYSRTFQTYPKSGSVLGTLCTGNDKAAYFVFFFVSFFMLPLLIMTVAYCRIARILWFLPLAQQTESVNNAREADARGPVSSERQRRNFIKMMMVLVVCFFACYFLHCFMVFHFMFDKEGLSNSPNFLEHGTRISHLLIYVNSAINPFIYNFLNPNFRNAFQRVFPCCRKKQAEEYRLERFRNETDNLAPTEVAEM